MHRPAITTLIGWLSVCLLAAAWGPDLGPRVRSIWNSIGAYGLAASLGLEALARVRRAHLDLGWRRQLASVQGRRLQQLDRSQRDSQTFREIGRRIAAAPRRSDRPVDAVHPVLPGDANDRRNEPRHSCWIPVEMFLFPIGSAQPDGADDAVQAQSEKGLPAYLGDVSGLGIGLYHRQPVDVPEAVVRFELREGEPIAILAKQAWCHKNGDGWYRSGWQFAGLLENIDGETLAITGSVA
ncbi:MAG: hypothetical protein K8T25_09235 [Planctomycetia bacterium]|nr:hypothetical protein [Planctomycetia bacterium]